MRESKTGVDALKYDHHITNQSFEDSDVERISVCFRISSNLTPNIITELTGLMPDFSSISPRYPKGLAKPRVHSETGFYWELDSEFHCSSKDIRRHLDYVCDKLLKAKEKLIELQSTTNLKMFVSANIWTANGGFVLWPEQMRKLAELNIEFGVLISNYCE